MFFPLFSLDDRVVIVTGASRGLGYAIARGFLDHHARVAVVARSPSIQEAFPEVPKNRWLAIQCDVTAPDVPARVRDAVCERFGRIDVLVNNAGMTKQQERPYDNDEIWDQTLELNLKAPFLLSGSVVEVMKRKREGSIINIASINAVVGFPDNPSYQASKGGLAQLTRAMARDWGQYNIRVNSISPGYFRTAMAERSYADPVQREERSKRTILGRWGEPEELVGACIFLASSAASYITGSDLKVDGGWTAKGL